MNVRREKGIVFLINYYEIRNIRFVTRDKLNIRFLTTRKQRYYIDKGNSLTYYSITRVTCSIYSVVDYIENDL